MTSQKIAAMIVQDARAFSPEWLRDAIAAALAEERARGEQAPSEFWERENAWWTRLANEEAMNGNTYEEHAYRTAAHAIRIARDHAEPARAEAQRELAEERRLRVQAEQQLERREVQRHSDLAALRACEARLVQAEQARDIIFRNEWSGELDSCPVCQRFPREGHSDCWFGDLVASVRDATPADGSEAAQARDEGKGGA